MQGRRLCVVRKQLDNWFAGSGCFSTNSPRTKPLGSNSSEELSFSAVRCGEACCCCWGALDRFQAGRHSALRRFHTFMSRVAYDLTERGGPLNAALLEPACFCFVWLCRLKGGESAATQAILPACAQGAVRGRGKLPSRRMTTGIGVRPLSESSLRYPQMQVSATERVTQTL